MSRPTVNCFWQSQNVTPLCVSRMVCGSLLSDTGQRNHLCAQPLTSANTLRHLVLKKDHLHELIMKDKHLKLYGSRLHAKHRHLNHLKSYVSQKVRELARLLHEAMQRYPDHIRETIDLLHPKNWEILVESALTVSKFNAEATILQCHLLTSVLSGMWSAV